ncbi:MAG: hypothetical protein H8D23_08425 [Candidatus Brocadiales bacterium]|nr:hypothetical protein [Candidatus Brocadiales bacterium]
MPNKNDKSKRYLKAGAGVALLGISGGKIMKMPVRSAAAQRFSKNIGGDLTWFGTDDGKRLKDLGTSIEGIGKDVGYKTVDVAKIKKGDTYGGGFYGHRGNLGIKHAKDSDLLVGKAKGKIYNKPSIAKDLEDNWTWYNQVKGEGVPKTILGSSAKSVKDIETQIGKDYIVKQRMGIAGKGLIDSKDFAKNPTKYLNDKHIVQKKEQLGQKYRVLVGEGKTVYVTPRSSNDEFIRYPTPHMAKEKDEAARFSEGIIARMSKNKNELHSLDVAKTKDGRYVAWENNSANGGNMFLSGEPTQALKDFAKGKSQVSYVQQRRAGAIQVGSAAVGAGVALGGARHEMKKSASTQQQRDDLRQGVGMTAAGGGAIGVASARQDFYKIDAKGGKQKRIALLHSPEDLGGGHKSAAIALEEKFKKKGYDVRRYDTGNYGGNSISRLVKGNVRDYKMDVQKNPAREFKSTFNSTNSKSSFWQRPIEAVKNFVSDLYQEARYTLSGEGKELTKDLKAYKPDKIISTYHGTLKGLKDSNRAIDLVATDYEISPNLWKTDNAGTYHVPNKKTREALVDAGVKGKKVNVTGEVPVVLKNFGKVTSNKSQIKNVVVMGGALGLRTHEVGPMVAEHYNRTGQNVKVTVLPGSGNTIARKHLAKNKKLPKNLSVWDPATSDYKRHMAKADLIVTRPGGSTTAELRALGKPVVTFTEAGANYANHEGGNVRTFLSSGQGKHIQLGDKIEPGGINNQKAVSKGLTEATKDYKNMRAAGAKGVAKSVKSQEKIVDSIMAQSSGTAKSMSTINKTLKVGGAVGAGLGIVSLMNAAKKKKNKK